MAPPWHAELIVERLSVNTTVQHECVDGAGHFSFMSPFPPAMVRADFLPAHDPAGFDRAAYQACLHKDITDFLDASLR